MRPPGFPACEINPEGASHFCLSFFFPPQNTLEYWSQFVLASEVLLFHFQELCGLVVKHSH